MIDYSQSPAYQRAVQRLGRIRPEQRAIMNSLSVDAKFADENTRKMLASLAQKQNTDYANQSLDLRRTAMNMDAGLRRQDFDYKKEQNRIATGVGMGQVASEAYFGRKRDDIEMQTLKKKMDFLDRLSSLYGGA